MPNLTIQRFIYRNLVQQPTVSRLLDRFDNALNKIGLTYATGKIRNKSIIFASNSPTEIVHVGKALLASDQKLSGHNASAMSRGNSAETLMRLLAQRNRHLKNLPEFSKRDRNIKLELFDALEDAAELPISQLIASGSSQPIWSVANSLTRIRDELGFRRRTARGYLEKVRRILLEAGKAADKNMLIKIMEDIDPPLRGILIRLYDLPFVLRVGNNCSGHFGEGSGYLEIYLSSDPAHNVSALTFCSLISEIEVPDCNKNRISHFGVTPRGLRLRPFFVRTRKTKPEYKDVWTRDFTYSSVQDLMQLWQQFSQVVAQFEKDPKDVHLTPDMFNPGKPGGRGYAGGKAMRAFCQNMLKQLNEINPHLVRKYYSELQKELNA
jgi:hypothetical protein